jgi:pSer/pThr/pTyr-binding forkhead associated (FHA) protein
MANKTIIDNDYNSFEKNPEKAGKYTQISGSDKKFERIEERTLVGFLVSYTTSEPGEYWLIREGRNLIGKFADNNIILKLPTVSDRHALLNVRRSKNDNRLMFVIKDENSTNGVFVNKEDIEYQPRELSDRDIIKIGDYELLLVIIDKITLNLKTLQDLSNIVKELADPHRRSSPYDYPVYDKDIKDDTVTDL